MPKSLKQILDQVNGETGFEIPANYFGNTDSNIVQIIAIANRSATDLRDMRLQYMVRQANIFLGPNPGGVLTPPTPTGTVDLQEDPDGRISWWPLPSDFYCLVPDTTYQNGRIDPVQLPTPAPDWAYLISRTGPQSLRVRCRFIRNRLYVFSPESSQIVQFEYISNAPVTTTAGATRQTFSADTDVWQLDDALIELDIKWRYKKEKGLDWGSKSPPEGDYKDFTDYANRLRGRDGGSQTLIWPNGYWWPNEPFANLWVA